MWRVVLLSIALVSCSVNQRFASLVETDDLNSGFPPIKTFPSADSPGEVRRSNRQVARDFLELAFEMESGRQLEVLTKFTKPITLALDKPVSKINQSELNMLLLRLRREAGINIRQLKPGSDADIRIVTLSSFQMHRIIPNAVCFVVPENYTWLDFIRNRHNGDSNWTSLRVREHATAFVPIDTSPQEFRDCIHEEIAQALGPLNDVYRLPNTIFNDDNNHAILTPFDMLILRAFYSPEIRNGMTRAEAARALPRLLARLNPAGERLKDEAEQKSPREWIDLMENSLGGYGGSRQRLSGAKKAVEIASEAGWNDYRLGLSVYTLGRVAAGIRAETAKTSFTRALSVYDSLYGKGNIHSAQVAMHLSPILIKDGQASDAITLIDRVIPAATRHKNAILLSTLLLIKAEALFDIGAEEEGEKTRLEGFSWARYGLGSDYYIKSRFIDIIAAARSGEALRY